MASKRDNVWLTQKAEALWQQYFGDIPVLNKMYFRFSRKARVRLGSIKSDRKGNSIITLSGYFRDKRVPEYVIEAVLAHEFCHYAHGFHSPLKKQCTYPHLGGVVLRELKKRGLFELFALEKDWLNKNWLKFIKEA